VSAKALILTSANWTSEVENAAEPVLVDFSATWCPPCRAIAPTIDALAGEFLGRVKVGTIDVDAEPELAERYNVRAMPTLLMLKGGRVLDQHLGAAPPERLRAFVAAHVPEAVCVAVSVSA
jgi:thioredoxin 1